MQEVPEAVQLLLPYLQGAETLISTNKSLPEVILSMHDNHTPEEIHISMLMAQSEMVRRCVNHQPWLSKFITQFEENMPVALATVRKSRQEKKHPGD